MKTSGRASVKDIAAKLNISLSTVHKALTGKPGVSERRRAEVISVAKELGYVVNTAAQSLARKDMTLAIILPRSWQEYFAELKTGMESEISALSEYKLRGEFFYITKETTTDELCSWIKSIGADLILICSSSAGISKMLLRATDKVSLPVFRVGGGVDNPRSVCNITIDAPLSGRLAADFFACSVSAPLCAAVFTGSLDIAVHKAKTDAFCERVAEYGGEVLRICETDDDEMVASEEISRLLNDRPEINCIYVSTSTSKSICSYIEKSGFAGRIKLVGTDVFDELCAYMKRGTMQATIYQNQEKVGRYAVRRAYDYLYAKNSYGGNFDESERNVLIAPKILLRANIE